MRNPELPKLLRNIGATKDTQIKIIYEQSAVELEKLEKIYKLVEVPRHVSIIDLLEILNEAP